MGAEKPAFPNTTENLQKNRLLLPLVVAMAVLLLGAGLFWMVYAQAEEAAAQLSPREETRLQQRLREIDESEQYALVANVNGWYPCLHSGRTAFYLRKGEVWKYGVTSKGKFGRYNLDFLTANKVSYEIEFKGTFSECLKQEQVKLFNYPYSPENLARLPEDRLPRPPYNRIMR